MSQLICSGSYSQPHTVNVLLMALSTFPANNVLYMNQFQYEGKMYSGRYQMDPIPKMLSERLRTQGKYLDKIIMLCTPDVLVEKEITVQPEGEKIVTSPLEYFKSQVRDYMNPLLGDEERFIKVDIKETFPARGMQEATHILRGIENLELYLDNHGGYRGIALTAEAIVSLLKSENVRIKGIFSVYFNPVDKDKKIINDSASFEMFDFVAGINEFINYGRIDSLENYLKKDSELLKDIRDIAEGIQLCDIPKFESGLERLADYYRENRKTDNMYLEIFGDNIKNDYGILLQENKTVLDEIRWCLKKGFYQQALTLIEARMPEELVNSYVLEYNDELDRYAEENRGPYEKNVYILNRTLPGSFSPKGNRTDEELAAEKLALIQNKASLKEYEDEIKQLKDSADIQRIKKMHFFVRQKEVKVRFPVFSHVRDQKLLCQFLRLHIALKELRNNSNHAGKKPINISVEQIKLAIEVYVSWADKLEKDGKRQKTVWNQKKTSTKGGKDNSRLAAAIDFSKIKGLANLPEE